MTIPDVLRHIEAQTDGFFRVSDFVPVPCCFPTCNSVTYAYVDGNAVLPLPRVLNVDDYLDYVSNRVAPDLGAEITTALEGLWSSSAVPGSEKAARAFALSCAVLRSGGRLGPSDLTRTGPLPPDLQGLLAWVACIADARPVAEYVACLQGAGLAVDAVEPHDEALAVMVRDIRTKLLGAEVLAKLKTLDLPGVDFEAAKAMVRSAADAVRVGTLGYTLIVAAKREA